jgi:hypothetical protein
MAMSAIFQNRFVNGVAALTAVLWALGAVPSASAQDADPRITGSCTPRTQDQGPWDCKINKFIRVENQTNKSTNYDEVWKSVRSVDEASELLKSMYLKLGGPTKFFQWLSSQGFTYVQMFSPNIEHPNSDNEVSIRMGIYYVPKTSPIPVTWGAYLFAYGAFCQIDIDNFGQIKKIEHRYEFE